jgi:hypothetical protein
MVVAVSVVAVVKVPAGPVVDVASVRDRRMAAAGAVLVGRRMDAALVAGRAGVRMAMRDEEHVVVHVVAVLVMQVAVVQVVLVAVVLDLVVPASVGVVMRVVFVVLAGVHLEPGHNRSACEITVCAAAAARPQGLYRSNGRQG